MSGVGFGLTGIAWNGGSRFWPDWNSLDWQKPVLTKLEWLVMEKIGLGPTGTARKKGIRFWPVWNGME
jgi:hypothetical protein